MFGYDNLVNFMETNFAMMQHHKYSLFDIENMIAWERQIYISILTDYIKEQNEKAKLERQTRR